MFNNYKYEKNTFNKKISKLPQTITHLAFGIEFNRDVSNLLYNLTNLTFHNVLHLSDYTYWNKIKKKLKYKKLIKNLI